LAAYLALSITGTPTIPTGLGRQLNQQEFEQSLEVLSATEQMRATQWKI
jgi:hypothetical protein